MVLRYRVAFKINEVYQNTRNMKFRNMGIRTVPMGRVVGLNAGYQFDNWYPSDMDRFVLAVRDVISGVTCWHKPVSMYRIGAEYWVKNGATKVAAAMFLGEPNLPGVKVMAYYVPALRRRTDAG